MLSHGVTGTLGKKRNGVLYTPKNKYLLAGDLKVMISINDQRSFPDGEG